jgi:hypothetical protein
MAKNESRYNHALEKCLSNASGARTPELKELWYTMADSYRLLLDSERRAITFHSWRRNSTPSSAKSPATEVSVTRL